MGGGGQTTSGEVGAGRLLDVLPAHLIPGGGGALSSMSMWRVSGVREGGRGRTREDGGGREGRKEGGWEDWGRLHWFTGRSFVGVVC